MMGRRKDGLGQFFYSFDLGKHTAADVVAKAQASRREATRIAGKQPRFRRL